MNKNVLVTGSSKGIGKSIAKLLCNSNYNVYICARNSTLLKKTAEEIGAKAWFSCDLTNFDDCQNLIKNIEPIDILINNAGSYVWTPIEKTKREDINNIIDLNIKATYILTSLCVEHMKKQKWGRIINIGSISGVIGEANASLYSLTKSALNGFSKALGLELAEYGITVNTINPGWVETTLAESSIQTSDFTNEEILEIIPQKRFIHPEEIANLVKYLISEDAKGLTAQNISLCAGLSAG